MKRTVRFFKYTLFTLFYVFLIVAILEVFLIALDPWIPLGPWMYDIDLGFKGRPYYGDWNSQGFCDKEHNIAKSRGIYRIIFLGDSFGTVGGVGGNVTNYLQSLMDTQFGPKRVEVINLSVPMTHTGEQLRILEKYGLRFDPDLVLLGFFCGNDFLDANPYRKRIAFCGSWMDIDKREEVNVFGRPLVRKSRLYELLTHYIVVGREIYRKRFEAQDRADSHAQEEAAPEKAPTFSESAFEEIEKRRFVQCDKKRMLKGNLRPHVDYVLDSISEMNLTLRNLSIKFVVAAFPDEFQVDASLSSQLLASLESTDEYDLLLPQKILKIHLEELGVPFIDLTGEFQSRASQEALYIPRDTHWNQAGRRLGAEQIFRYIAGEIGSEPLRVER